MNDTPRPIVLLERAPFDGGYHLLDPSDRSPLFGPVWSLAACDAWAKEHGYTIVRRDKAPRPS